MLAFVQEKKFLLFWAYIKGLITRISIIKVDVVKLCKIILGPRDFVWSYDPTRDPILIFLYKWSQYNPNQILYNRIVGFYNPAILDCAFDNHGPKWKYKL